MNNTILLNSRPVGTPKLTDFKFVTEEMPVVKDDEVLLKTKFISVDPYLRGRMSAGKSYIKPFEVHQVMSSGAIAVVVESKNENFKVGDFVSGALE